MNNEQQIKEILGNFIHLDAAHISEHTVIDRSAVQSSILIHRMYAALAEAGLVIANPGAIKTFGDLQQAAGLEDRHAPSPALPTMPADFANDGLCGGIDIEDISRFNMVTDYREDEFYRQNFSPAEIAWCILQPNPLASFGGKFAAKEAIVKADNRFKFIPFYKIEVLNDPDGKPQFKGFEISISHTQTTAIAMAIASGSRASHIQIAPRRDSIHDKWLWGVAIAALLLALASFAVR